MNVGAKSVEDYGPHFSWGNIAGHKSSNDSTFDDVYSFDATSYESTAGHSLSADIPSNDAAHDAAQALYGDYWCMPTHADFQELVNNTDQQISRVNGIYGMKFMKKSDHSVYIFLPAAGRGQDSSVIKRGSDGTGYYWSSSWTNAENAHYTNFYYDDNEYGSYVNPDYSLSRYLGFSIRAVYKEPKPYVDLGLPSGLKWAKGNVVSDGNGGYAVGNMTDYGAYVSWGNVEPHFSSNGSTFDDGYNWGEYTSGRPYRDTPGRDVNANISSTDSSHDAARALLGDAWHLPTKDNFTELINNTDKEVVTINGVRGTKFMKKSDHSVYIFLPYGGVGINSSLKERGTKGLYWSSTYFDVDRAYALSNTSVILDYTYSCRASGLLIRAVQ
jgi:uncharacterized protein (TIGR02145 family)